MMEYTHSGLLEQAINAVVARQPKSVFFVACGGSLAYMYNQQYMLDVETDLPTAVINSNEFIHRNPKLLGENSLVITCSHSGDTPETVAATKFARERGALTVAYTHRADSPLWKSADFALHYDWGEGSDAYENRSGMALRFIFGFLNAFKPGSTYQHALDSVKNLGDIFDANITKFKDRADHFGKIHKRDSIIYTLGSGPIYGDAYSFTACLLQEMLWVHSNAIHSGEFFHGPFEITDFDVPFLLTKTYGQMRPLDERAHAFLEKYSERLTIIDAQEFDWGGIKEEVRQFFAAPIFGAVLRAYAEQLSFHRGHPLSVRRYMWRVEY
ncbi:SIS domain-containing protein [Alkalispirochaeta alkalica]|uniref:SIS domain-containing protein n=1 Tax=Alkalispirochaeta alkalica TaxID=46356 RepID=UPI000370189D|nr:SIS domain-containing protein [Alkalispirochaeta alkalica]